MNKTGKQGRRRETCVKCEVKHIFFRVYSDIKADFF